MDKKPEYMSDKQLEDLIRDVETKGLIEAPEQLKGNVLQAIERKQELLKQRKSRELLKFGIKIVFSTAAAIAFLVLVPMDQQIPSSQTAANVMEDRTIQNEADGILKNIYVKSTDFCMDFFIRTNSLLN